MVESMGKIIESLHIEYIVDRTEFGDTTQLHITVLGLEEHYTIALEKNDFISNFDAIIEPAIRTLKDGILKVQSQCNHNWVDADNEVVKNTLICTKCHLVKAKDERKPT